MFLNLLQTSWAQDLKFQSVDALKHSSDIKQSDSEPLTLLWGIPDTTAYVGKLFTFTLPNDAFQGNVVHYDVTEAAMDALPSWLSFNPLKAELRGIPEPRDKGQVYIEVKAIGDHNSQADDVFSIEVVDDSSMSVGASKPKIVRDDIPKLVRCRREEPETVSTVIIDVDIRSLNPSERIAIFSNLASHLNLATEMLKLLPVGDKPMFDTTALVAGPGDTKAPKHQGVLVSWLVGCGKVESDHLPVLQQLEMSAKNGDMGSALGHSIVGWHVTNSRFQQKPRRKRAATATPTMSMPAPTKVSDMSSASIAPTSSVVIQPTKTVEVQPTSVVVQPSSSVSMETSSITPSPTVQMTKTMSVTPEPTTVLPSKTFTMTTSAVTTPTPTTSTESTTESTTKSTKKPTTEKPTPEPKCPPPGRATIRKAPMVEKPIRNFTIMAGEVFRFKIPEDTFFDCYDHKTSDLTLQLLLNDETIPNSFWMQLKRKLFKPYRLVANPLNIHSKNYKFVLRAENFYSKVTEMEFFIDVLGEEMAKAPPSHELSMTIDMDYGEFTSDLNNRLEVTNKLANLYGDSNSDSIMVTRIDRGSVIFAWTNKTLSGESCPAGDIENLVNKLVNKDGSLSYEATEAMLPYKISSAASVPLGECANNPNFPKIDTKKAKMTTTEKPMTKPMTTLKVEPTPKPTPEPTMKPTEKTTPKPFMPPTPKPKPTEKEEKTVSPSTTTETKVAAAGAGGGSDIWITTVVPAIVVVVVLIIALVIACCLYRKKRKGKMNLEEKNSYSNKAGAPVIFADEYEDRPNDSSKPLIMRDEKPPILPPEYQRAPSEGSAGSNSTQPIGEGEEIEMDETSPLYQPPPPVTASSSNKPPPPHLQASRSPPPYVPP